MALIKCTECSTKIADKIGTICPSCGNIVDENVLEQNRKNKLSNILISTIFYSIVIYLLLYNFDIIGTPKQPNFLWKSFAILVGFNIFMNTVYVIFIKLSVNYPAIYLSRLHTSTIP